MNHMNNCVLLGNYKGVSINNDKTYLFIAIKDTDGDITIPISIPNNIANQIKHNCNENDLIGIKAKIDIDEDKLIIEAIKLTFLCTQNRAN